MLWVLYLIYICREWLWDDVLLFNQIFLLFDSSVDLSVKLTLFSKFVEQFMIVG